MTGDGYGPSTDGNVKRSVVIAGHRTSVSLEPAFWEALKRIAADRRMSINALIGEIDRGRHANLSSAIRVYILKTVEEAMVDG